MDVDGKRKVRASAFSSDTFQNGCIKAVPKSLLPWYHCLSLDNPTELVQMLLNAVSITPLNCLEGIMPTASRLGCSREHMRPFLWPIYANSLCISSWNMCSQYMAMPCLRGARMGNLFHNGGAIALQHIAATTACGVLTNPTMTAYDSSSHHLGTKPKYCDVRMKQ